VHIREKLYQIFLPWLEKNGQVAAIHYMMTIAPCLCHQKAKRRVEFRCTASNIDSLRSSDSIAAQILLLSLIVYPSQIS